MEMNDSLIDYFDCIYIINLPERLDRRDEMEEQLNKIYLSLTHPKIHLFNAIKPDSAGEFDSIGARGCFMSHLGILKHAKAHQFKRVLVLEDDLNFANDFNNRIQPVINQLSLHDWQLFYGGYLGLSGLDSQTNQNVVSIPSSVTFHGAHFVAFQNEVITQMVDYLELLISRKNGDPRGGPMHVDGAYLTYRQQDCKTLLAVPELGYQRASRTDIHNLAWHDKQPVMRYLISHIRKLKNKLTAN